MECALIKFSVDIKLLDQLTHLKAGWPSRGGRMKEWATGTSARFLSENECKSCAWKGRAPCNDTGWDLTIRGAALLKISRQCWWMQGGHEPAVCPGSKES